MPSIWWVTPWPGGDWIHAGGAPAPLVPPPHCPLWTACEHSAITENTAPVPVARQGGSTHWQDRPASRWLPHLSCQATRRGANSQGSGGALGGASGGCGGLTWAWGWKTGCWQLQEAKSRWFTCEKRKKTRENRKGFEAKEGWRWAISSHQSRPTVNPWEEVCSSHVLFFCPCPPWAFNVSLILLPHSHAVLPAGVGWKAGQSRHGQKGKAMWN